MDIFYSALMLLTGIGVSCRYRAFSGALTKSASGRMRLLFRRISRNRTSGFGPAVTQSSAVTTVVGLVNAGLITLFQATAIKFGANVGTALTTLIVSFSVF